MNESFVKAGDIVLTLNPSIVSSRYFAYCSAIVLDYGDGNIFAHAFPRWPGYKTPPFDTNVDNVIDRLIQMVPDGNKTRLNAFINAGIKDDLENLVKELKRREINILGANTDYAPPYVTRDGWKSTRHVTYNSEESKLVVIPI